MSGFLTNAQCGRPIHRTRRVAVSGRLARALFSAVGWLLCLPTTGLGAAWVGRQAAVLPYPGQRVGATATELPDGRILIAGGGVWPWGTQLRTTLLFEPETGAFLDGPELSTERGGHSATLLPDGRVLYCGGMSAANIPLASADVVDPSSGAVSVIALQYPRHGHTATLIDATRVMLVGGRASPTTIEVVDCSTGTSSVTRTLGGERAWHGATLAPGFGVVLAGGGTAAVELIPLDEGPTQRLGSLAAPRGSATATLLSGQRVLVTGGDIDIHAPTAEVFDLVSGETLRDFDLRVARGVHRAWPLPSGGVLLVGGRLETGAGVESPEPVELVEPDVGSSRVVGSSILPHLFAPVVVTSSGSAWLFGGVTGFENSQVPYVTAWVEEGRETLTRRVRRRLGPAGGRLRGEQNAGPGAR